MEKYNILIEKDEDGWLVSSVIELPGCHTQAKTFDELIKRTKEAIKSYTLKQKIKIPVSSFVALQQVEV